MPYTYEYLKRHISEVHPEILDSFVEGWNRLGPVSQAKWLQQGLLAPRQKVEVKYWFAWTTIKIDELFEARKLNNSFEFPVSKFEKQFAIIFHDSMKHANDFFNLPYMPPLKGKSYGSPMDDNNRSRSERHAIVKDAAKVVVRIEMENALRKWRKDLDEYGVDALRRVYLMAAQLKDDEKFEFEDLDCDSDSNISND
jgi:hypothetical protein